MDIKELEQLVEEHYAKCSPDEVEQLMVVLRENMKWASNNMDYDKIREEEIQNLLLADTSKLESSREGYQGGTKLRDLLGI